MSTVGCGLHASLAAGIGGAGASALPKGLAEALAGAPNDGAELEDDGTVGASGVAPNDGADPNAVGLPSPSADGFAVGEEKARASDLAASGFDEGRPKHEGFDDGAPNADDGAGAPDLALKRDGVVASLGAGEDEEAGGAPNGEATGAPNGDVADLAPKPKAARGAAASFLSSLVAPSAGAAGAGGFAPNSDGVLDAAGAPPNEKAGLSVSELGVVGLEAGRGTDAGTSSDLLAVVVGFAPKRDGDEAAGDGAPKRDDGLAGAAPNAEGAPKADDEGGALAGVVNASPKADLVALVPKPANADGGACAPGLASGDDALGVVDPNDGVEPKADSDGFVSAAGEDAGLSGASPPKMLVSSPVDDGLLAACPNPPKPPLAGPAEKPPKPPPAGATMGATLGPPMVDAPKAGAEPNAETGGVETPKADDGVPGDDAGAPNGDAADLAGVVDDGAPPKAEGLARLAAPNGDAAPNADGAPNGEGVEPDAGVPKGEAEPNAKGALGLEPKRPAGDAAAGGAA